MSTIHLGRSSVGLFRSFASSAHQGINIALQTTRKLPINPTPVYWTDLTNQRAFLNAFAEAANIRDKRQWAQVSQRQIITAGGRQLLRIYDNSIVDALKAVYPNQEWDEHDFDNREAPERRAYRYWLKRSNQRAFLDQIAEEFNVQNASDWIKVPIREVLQRGGSGLLHHYNDSFFSALVATYPDLHFNLKDFLEAGMNGKVPKNYWADLNNQRRFMEEIREDLNIRDYKDWRKVTQKEIVSRGGRGFLDLYQGSLVKAVETLFPNEELHLKGAFQKPRGYYGEVSNQRREFDHVAKVLGIQNFSNWPKVTLKEIRECGGAPLLKQYGGSLYEALCAVYPEEQHKLNASDFHNVPKGYWADPANQKKFMDKIAEDLQIKKSDWGRVSHREIYERGGGSLLTQHKGSLLAVLQAVYPEKNFADQILRRRTSSIVEHRMLLDSIGKELAIGKTSGWKGITTQQFVDKGGRPLLNHYGSLSKALAVLYPEDFALPENRSNEVSKKPPGYWQDLKNQRDFLEQIARDFNLSCKEDWSKISIKDIIDKGGYMLLRQYNNSIVWMLKTVFPEQRITSSEVIQQGFRSKAQQEIWEILKQWIDDLHFNYKHPDLAHAASNKPMELDLYSPSLKLAIEYQGQQHFEETHRGSLDKQKIRDEEKRAACSDLGITMVEIPFWWDRSESQLTATILKYRPDIETFKFYENSDVPLDPKLPEMLPEGT
eukprot:TRINITY_DN5405_c0_g1_i1.p1 TRINITY_DN5405_c0_g1~~TRINITY_DN5405_c0_g1_i1.p1  ORF type:complete len:716 (-),score=103.25 TRINITY_DN5405_c0_g1_i1:1172-3319(-)